MARAHNFKDLTGLRSGRLEVVKLDCKNKFGQMVWLCRCECGNYTTVVSSKIISQKAQSCGCINKERIAALSKARATHRMTGTRVYHIWQLMKQRCYNENKDGYERYGGRGIRVCEEWKSSFEGFYKWSMANGYTDKKSIDRINVNGNYEPSNCRWTTSKEQCNNRSSNHNIEYKGEIKTLEQWAEEKGLTRYIIHHRLKKGWSIEKTLETPRERCNHHKKRPSQSTSPAEAE